MSRVTTWGVALVLAAPLALVGTGAWAGTRFTSSWKAPDAQPESFKGAKVAALVMHPDESLRYPAEEALAREITARGPVGMPAYSIVPKELIKDKDKAREFLEKAGVVGVLAMRVVGKDKEITQSPGTYWGGAGYATFWGAGYYGTGWGAVYEPGYLRTDTIVEVETLIYSLRQDKLVWAGRSETTNPKDVPKFVKELAKKVADQLKKLGLSR